MKKIIFISMLTLLTAFSVQAMECAEGTVLRTNNGTEYCKSNTSLSWKAAAQWCAAQKMKQPSWEELCPGSHFGKNCDNLRGTGELSVWTSTTAGEGVAMRINLSCGCTNKNQYSHKYYAICK